MRKIVVIGSGVMGSGIAAHIANSGTAVVMLDVVPEGAKNRNIFTESAVERMLGEKKSPFSLKSNAQLITCGNLEDGLHLVADADWIIEAVTENLDIKQNVYHKLEQVRKSGSIISSNTSTIPLADLITGMPDRFQQDMLITHFFNPPRTMNLIELVTSEKNKPSNIKYLTDFLDTGLGKVIVHANDTPGFIANRIGIFWLVTALVKSIALGISVEEADSLMGKPIGIPKTGIFGLMDLIGIDLIPLMAESMLRNLPASDELHQIYKEPLLVRRMITQGYTGKKGKGGFYRTLNDDGQPTKQVMDLISGQYRTQQQVTLESADSTNIKALITSSDKGGEYAWQVLSLVLTYACHLIPDAANSILDMDTAMKEGFNWKYGPFELIDQLNPSWFREKLEAENRVIPPMLDAIGERKFYQDRQYYLGNTATDYRPIPFTEEAWQLADITYQQSPILTNDSATLWDIGDGIACLALTTKMNSLNSAVFTLIEEAIPIIEQQFKGLVIGNDNNNFSVGLNLNLLHDAINIKDHHTISTIIRHGQQGMLRLKYAPFPVVSAVSNMALGGGCELILYSDAAQAHIGSTIGLVESNLGLLPGWGGCTALLFRHLHETDAPDERMNAVFSIFKQIAFARKGGSAEEARKQHFLNEQSRISTNRKRLLADAKNLCLSMATNYQPPIQPTLYLKGDVIRSALSMTIYGLERNGTITPQQKTVLNQLAIILSADGTGIEHPVTEQQLLDLEHNSFMRLAKHR